MSTRVEKIHTPSSIWTAFNINSHEEYIDKLFVNGKFHAKVPDQIIESYERVEGIFCYGYYHYPLIDEAFSSATRIFESAINMRLDELNLSKTGTLQKKIIRLEPYTTPTLFRQWEHTRKIRNHFAHPNPGSLMGITLIKGFKRIVNTLNAVFLDKRIIDYYEEQLKILLKKSSHLKDRLFVLVSGEERFLIDDVKPCSVVEVNSQDKSLWTFQAVMIEFPQTMDKASFGSSVFKVLENIKIYNNGLSATDAITGMEIQLIVSNDMKNTDHYQKYKAQYKSSEKVVRALHRNHIELEIADEIESFVYNEAWTKI